MLGIVIFQKTTRVSFTTKWFLCVHVESDFRYVRNFNWTMFIFNVYYVDDGRVRKTTGTCALVVSLFIFNLFRTSPPTIRPFVRTIALAIFAPRAT